MTAANCNEKKPRKVVELPPGSKLAYTVDESAQALGVGTTAIWTMIREGEVVAKKVRGRTVIAREELLRVLEEAPAARAA